VRFFPLLWLACALAAQDQPQFIWRGEVDSGAILYLRGDKLEVKATGRTPVSGQQFHFYNQLPDLSDDARLEVRQGRGYVHVIDQPRLENHYTLAIAIEDRQAGSSPYSIAVFWNTSNREFERGGGRTGKLVWTGRIDQEALISCQEKRCTSQAVIGAPVAAEKFKFSRALPRRDVDVNLEDTEGRGEIRLVEQPRERNNYTAKVSIRDPQGGSGEYSFKLAWREAKKKESIPVMTAGRGMIWKGLVSGNVRVTIHGRSAFSQILGNAAIREENADFMQPLPARMDLSPVIRTLQGRGSVRIVENPTEKNNYTLVFEISDSGSGLSPYEVELDW